MDVLVALVKRWRSEATILEEHGAHHEATTARRRATELEAGILEWQLQALTLHEAALESGYSYSALQQMVADGELPNAGGKHKPRIRRCDMPRKAGRRSPSLLGSAPDLVDLVQAAS